MDPAYVEVAIGIVVVGGEFGGGGIDAFLAAIDHGDAVEFVVVVGDIVATGGAGFGSGEVADCGKPARKQENQQLQEIWSGPGQAHRLLSNRGRRGKPESAGIRNKMRARFVQRRRVGPKRSFQTSQTAEGL
jgi:hypothetical protein